MIELNFEASVERILKLIPEISTPKHIEEVVLVKSILTCIVEGNDVVKDPLAHQLCSALSESLITKLNDLDIISLQSSNDTISEVIKRKRELNINLPFNEDHSLASRLLTLIENPDVPFGNFENYLVNEAIYFTEFKSMSSEIITVDILLYLLSQLERMRPETDKAFIQSLYKDIQIWFFTKECSRSGKMRLASSIIKKRLFIPQIEEQKIPHTYLNFGFPWLLKERKRSSIEELFDLFSSVDYMMTSRFICPSINQDKNKSHSSLDD